MSLSAVTPGCTRREALDNRSVQREVERPHERYKLAPHVRACFAASGAVLLDLRRNRYFGLSPGDADLLLAALRDPSGNSSFGRLALHLQHAGLLSALDAGEGMDAATHLDPPVRSVGQEFERSIRSGPSEWITFLRACIWARYALRFRSLYSLVHEFQNRERPICTGAQDDDQRIIELVCVFRRLRRFAFTARDRCLFHSLALMRFLSHYNLSATWVIGVRLRPWKAHSWVQYGSMALDSSPEQIVEFTPILVV